MATKKGDLTISATVPDDPTKQAVLILSQDGVSYMTTYAHSDNLALVDAVREAKAQLTLLQDQATAKAAAAKTAGKTTAGSKPAAKPAAPAPAPVTQEETEAEPEDTESEQEADTEPDTEADDTPPPAPQPPPAPKLAKQAKPAAKSTFTPPPVALSAGAQISLF